MNENNVYKVAVSSSKNDLLYRMFINKDLLEEVIKFHQSQLWLPLNLEDHTLNEWKDISHINIIENPFNTTIIRLPISKQDNDIKSNLEQISNLMNKAFKGDYRKSANYKLTNTNSILPLLLVFKENVLDNIKPGCYMYNSSNHSLTELQVWDKSNIESFQDITSSKSLPSNTAFAYALDLRRATLDQGKRGYRNALIEVGTLIQKIKDINKPIKNSKINFSEEMLTDFSDNALTYLCGLNTRLAPVVSVQWFSLKGSGEDFS
ncbi:hypothetical protein V1498_12325 [Peribacillus sp. SCS-26]|uniref:hypothetical protein n=1 Tax=Paraperibacillus marinus TaxID=3115295 RepID=UPI0039065342